MERTSFDSQPRGAIVPGARFAKLKQAYERLIDHGVGDILDEEMGALTSGAARPPSGTDPHPSVRERERMLLFMKHEMSQHFSAAARQGQAEVLRRHRVEECLGELDAQEQRLQLSRETSAGPASQAGARAPSVKAELKAAMEEQDKRRQLSMLRHHAMEQRELNNKQARQNEEVRACIEAVLDRMDKSAQTLVAIACRGSPDMQPAFSSGQAWGGGA